MLAAPAGVGPAGQRTQAAPALSPGMRGEVAAACTPPRPSTGAAAPGGEPPRPCSQVSARRRSRPGPAQRRGRPGERGRPRRRHRARPGARGARGPQRRLLVRAHPLSARQAGWRAGGRERGRQRHLPHGAAAASAALALSAVGTGRARLTGRGARRSPRRRATWRRLTSSRRRCARPTWAAWSPGRRSTLSVRRAWATTSAATMCPATYTPPRACRASRRAPTTAASPSRRGRRPGGRRSRTSRCTHPFAARHRGGPVLAVCHALAPLWLHLHLRTGRACIRAA